MPTQAEVVAVPLTLARMSELLQDLLFVHQETAFHPAIKSLFVFTYHDKVSMPPVATQRHHSVSLWLPLTPIAPLLSFPSRRTLRSRTVLGNAGGPTGPSAAESRGPR